MMGLVNSATRTAIFIDGWNFARVTYEGLGIRVDFRRLLSLLCSGTTLVRARYYIGEWSEESYALYAAARRARGLTVEHADPAEAERRRRDQQGFIRMLNRNGYQVVRRGMRVHVDGTVKAEIGIDLAVDAMWMADHCDRMVLVMGDAEYVPLVHALALKGVRVVVAGSQSNWAYNHSVEHPRPFPGRASDELLDAADEFIELREAAREIELHDEARRSMRPAATPSDELEEISN
ncbi:NYN domain-containing protein [bacterium]|nr:MAG: NYN domain-containing protein [bacterium]